MQALKMESVKKKYLASLVMTDEMNVLEINEINKINEINELMKLS